MSTTETKPITDQNDAFDLAAAVREIPILLAAPTEQEALEGIMREEGYTEWTQAPMGADLAALCAEQQPRLTVVAVDSHDEVEQVHDLVVALDGDCASILAVLHGESRALRREVLAAGAKDFLIRPIDSLAAAARIRGRLEVCALLHHVQEQNENLEKKIQQRTKALHDSQLDLVHRLARAAEFRDNDTGHHVARLSLYAVELGRAAGLSEPECDLLLNASALHDVGKIGISDEVLLKPGSHSSDETALMRSHVEMGVAILGGSDHELLQLAETIARTHHERWDGTGYPKGLGGKEIPLVGRIVAICDVFDALTSARPYKPAWTTKAAVDEIVMGRGTHFDPELIELFLGLMPRIELIQAGYATAARIEG